MNDLNRVKLIIMQFTIGVSDIQDLVVVQATLLLKANGKVFHYLEYIL
jgi:hypothetical protein